MLFVLEMGISLAFTSSHYVRFKYSYQSNLWLQSRIFYTTAFQNWYFHYNFCADGNSSLIGIVVPSAQTFRPSRGKIIPLPTIYASLTRPRSLCTETPWDARTAGSFHFYLRLCIYNLKRAKGLRSATTLCYSRQHPFLSYLPRHYLWCFSRAIRLTVEPGFEPSFKARLESSKMCQECQDFYRKHYHIALPQLNQCCSAKPVLLC